MALQNFLSDLAMDLNHLLPETEFKVGIIANILNIDRNRGSAILTELVGSAFITPVGRGIYNKLDMAELPPPARRKTLYELRARYGWCAMPQEDYYKRIHMLLPDKGITVGLVQEITKLVVRTSADAFLTKMHTFGFLERVKPGVFNKAVLDLPIPEEYYDTNGLPKLIAPNVIVLQMPGASCMDDEWTEEYEALEAELSEAKAKYEALRQRYEERNKLLEQLMKATSAYEAISAEYLRTISELRGSID